MSARSLAGCLAALALRSPQESPPKSAEPPATADAACAARLAEQRAALEAELAAMEEFGHHEEFLAKVVEIVDAPDRPPQKTAGEMFAIGEKQGVTYASAEGIAAWHRPTEPGRPQAWADRDDPRHPAPIIVDFRDQLRARGIDLLLVVIPSVLEIYPELLLEFPSMEGFAGMGLGTVRFLLDLNAAGVETLDLRPVFVAARGTEGDRNERLYLRSDPHWSPRGAELGARAVADRIASLPWFVRGPMATSRDFQLRPATFNYVVDSPLPPSTPESVTSTSITERGRPFLGCSDNSRFVVLGDSFVTVFEVRGASFPAHLAHRIGHRVTLIGCDGGAATETRKKLALWPAERWQNRKLVVWCLTDSNLGQLARWVKVPIFHE